MPFVSWRNKSQLCFRGTKNNSYCKFCPCFSQLTCISHCKMHHLVPIGLCYPLFHHLIGPLLHDYRSTDWNVFSGCNGHGPNESYRWQRMKDLTNVLASLSLSHAYGDELSLTIIARGWTEQFLLLVQCKWATSYAIAMFHKQVSFQISEILTDKCMALVHYILTPWLHAMWTRQPSSDDH